MPSGKTHTKLNLIALPVIIVLLFSYGYTSKSFLLFFTIGFIIGTYFLSPDLDIRSASYRKWGLFRIIWYPYQVIMPHRSFLTHTFIIGDLIRLLYLLFVLSPILYFANKTVLNSELVSIVESNKTLIFNFVTGVMSASAVHIIADVLNTKRKKLFRKKRKRR
ncbi:metal-binding protein [Bacillus sp. 165]|uniref:metal-binding protein n=1 Tax=Bacillus sp. 165 TaxID=1529117 RepID=UPI001ADCE88B|nr:metal-binding protein [Bacillus sp. 165]MBO9129970.1 metal-binding protein [Bacillus sp. 165]